MAKRVTIRTNSTARRVGNAIQVRTTVSNGKTTKTTTRTIRPK